MNFDHPEFLWTLWNEAYFSIFKVKKINQNLLQFITQRVFLAKPTTLNTMSISVFWPEKVGRFVILIMSATNVPTTLPTTECTYNLNVPQPENGFFLKLFPIKNKNLFFIFCELWKLYSSKVILWNEEEGIICLNDEV